MNSIASASFVYLPSVAATAAVREPVSVLNSRQQQATDTASTIVSGDSPGLSPNASQKPFSSSITTPATEEQQAEVDKKQAAAAAEQRQLEQDQQEIAQLAARDREVRAHEQAHMAVGGQYAGAASYQYQRGPDGVNYAVAGEVPIDVGREATPQATITKMQVVKRAALAPAEPSSQDRKVAAQAAQIEAQARQELREVKEESKAEPENSANSTEQNQQSQPVDNSGVDQQAGTVDTSNRAVYQLLASIANTEPFTLSSRKSSFSSYA